MIEIQGSLEARVARCHGELRAAMRHGAYPAHLVLSRLDRQARAQPAPRGGIGVQAHGPGGGSQCLATRLPRLDPPRHADRVVALGRRRHESATCAGASVSTLFQLCRASPPRESCGRADRHRRRGYPDRLCSWTGSMEASRSGGVSAGTAGAGPGPAAAGRRRRPPG